MRIYIMASILIILGLIAIGYSGTLPKDNSWLPYLNELSSAFLVGGLLSLLFKIFQDRQSETNLRRLLRIHDSVDELGLVEILPESQAFNFTPLIQDSATLSIVMNDGLRWVGNNTVSLQNRFSKSSATEFFFVDPESPFVSSLAAKTSTAEEELKKKITDTWKRLEECYQKSDRKGSLKEFKLKTYPTKSIFLSENFLIETPYQTASGRANIPVFVYRKVARTDGPFSFALNDLKALKEECSLVKEYKHGS